MKQQEHHLTRTELHAYLDGQVSADSAGAVSRHLDECRRCREILEDMRRVHLAMRSLPVARLDESFTERVMAQVGLSTVNAGIFRFIVYLPSVVGLMLVLGVMGGAYLLAGGSGKAEPSGLEQTGSTLMRTLDSGAGALVGWLASVGSSGALAISAFALGLLLLVALGELLPAGPVRKDRERLRDSASG